MSAAIVSLAVLFLAQAATVSGAPVNSVDQTYLSAIEGLPAPISQDGKGGVALDGAGPLPLAAQPAAVPVPEAVAAGAVAAAAPAPEVESQAPLASLGLGSSQAPAGELPEQPREGKKKDLPETVGGAVEDATRAVVDTADKVADAAVDVAKDVAKAASNIAKDIANVFGRRLLHEGA